MGTLTKHLVDNNNTNLYLNSTFHHDDDHVQP